MRRRVALHGRRARDELGDTLIEVLIAVIIIGLAVGPLLGALVEATAGSSEHRALATDDTLLESFAETAKSHVELAASTPGFTGCASTYRLISKPSSLSTHAGSAVTVFVTGFPKTSPLATFTVAVGPARATTATPKVVGQSLTRSDSNGNMQITFLVPAGLPPTPEPITVSDGTTSVSSTTGSGITVDTGLPLIGRSPDAGYRMGIASVERWHPARDQFSATCRTTTTATAPLRSGIELVTLRAVAPGGVSDTLTFVVRNPGYLPPPKPTPTLSVVGRSVALPSSGTETLTFVATVSVATTPPPTGTVTWAITGPGGAVTCSSTAQTSGPTSETSTCDISITPSSPTGSYEATASYPASTAYTAATGSASATVYAPDGSGTMTVSPASVVAASTGANVVLTYTAATGGTSDGQVDVVVPPGWTTPQSTSATSAGYTTATGGSGSDAVGVSGSTIEVTGVTLASGQALTIRYSAVTAPSTTGPYTFAASEASLSGTAPRSLASSPTVDVVYVVTGATGTDTLSVSIPTMALGAGTNYAVYAFSSQSGPGGSAAVTATGFAGPQTFTPIGSPQGFDATADHDWAWYTTGTGGSGAVTVTFGKVSRQAFLEVVQLSGSTASPVVTTDEGFHVAASPGATATASLSATPSNPSDPEVLFVSTEGATKAAPSAVPGAVEIASADTTAGSFAIYTGKVRKVQGVPITPNWWGTVALEIHG